MRNLFIHWKDFCSLLTARGGGKYGYGCDVSGIACGLWVRPE